MRRLLLLPALAAVLLAAAPAGTATAKPRACAPSALSFKRTTGKTAGMLRWRAPRDGAADYRILRNGRVVAQTTHRSLRIRVRLGRTYRFGVTPLGHARCTTTRRLRVAYRAPGAPRHLTVHGGESGLTLRWKPGARGDGTLAGYRLRRGTATLGQTKHTHWTVSAAANRSYRFTVVAVDTRGHVSRPSNAVGTATHHAPPTTPQHVQALAVSDSEVGVSWQASKAHAGHIEGYRVLRDGVVVKEVHGTSLVLENLAASSDYDISVVAVDSLGTTSQPSAAVPVHTGNPVPTSGHAQAFLLASTDQSFDDFRAHYQQIGVVYPTYFDCTGSVDVSGHDDPLVTQWATARKVRVLPRVNCQETARVHKILTDPATRAHWLDALTALAAANGYDGLSIDFEAGPASDRDAYSSFVEALAARLHAAGKLLALAVSAKTHDDPAHPRSGIFDYPRLAQSADWIVVMAWGLHWTTSAPGPQDDATWVSQIASYVATMPSEQKFIFGTNLYAMDWPAGGGSAHPATAYQYGDIVPRLPALAAATALDPVADNFHATYTDAGGVGHDVWYPDATTSGRRMRLAAGSGFGGIAFWRLGDEDQRLWSDPMLAPGTQW